MHIQNLGERANQNAIYREGPLIAFCKIQRVRISDEGVNIEIDLLELLEGDLEFKRKSVTLFAATIAIGVYDHSLFCSYVGWELLFSDSMIADFTAFRLALPPAYSTSERFRAASEYLISWRNEQDRKQWSTS